MSKTVGLIPRNRLKLIPKEMRLAHEYCFFLHDENVRQLKEYEAAEAHFVGFDFPSQEDADHFQMVAAENDPITSMRKCGYETEAQRLILNEITMAMASDCLHHLYEALRCLEKRKIIVAFNLLRKPLTDNLLYLSWMLGDEDAFYHKFSEHSPNGITASVLKKNRTNILSKALEKTKLSNVISTESIETTLFDSQNPEGFQMFFQHAVHLITTQRLELKTTSENFNFIFKDPNDDELYHFAYEWLPPVLLYLSHIISELLERIQQADVGSKQAFETRSIFGLFLIEGGDEEQHTMDELANQLKEIQCPTCNNLIKLTVHNATRIMLSESIRCSTCQRVEHFPFSWTF